MASDLPIEDLLVSIQNCWCEALQDSVGGAPATCCIIVGQPVVPDCCSGFAWVRMLSAYPTLDFPSQDTEAHRCRVDTWAAVIEIGVTRCAPQPCDPLGNPCCDSEFDATLAMLDDFARLRRLLSCCVGVPADSVVPGQWAVQGAGAEGGCLTNAIQATFRFASGDCGC